MCTAVSTMFVTTYYVLMYSLCVCALITVYVFICMHVDVWKCLFPLLAAHRPSVLADIYTFKSETVYRCLRHMARFQALFKVVNYITAAHRLLGDVSLIVWSVSKGRSLVVSFTIMIFTFLWSKFHLCPLKVSSYWCVHFEVLRPQAILNT